MKNLIFFVLAISFITYSLAQNQYPRANEIDVNSYSFTIDVNDSTDIIKGKAVIEVFFKTNVSKFHLDLVKKMPNGNGMTVSTILENESIIPFTHDGNKLELQISPAHRGDRRTYSIDYQGIPNDGLIISKNKFGDRTFFSDNWPDRGQNWLPIVDHPSDKATVEWFLQAPKHYQTIGNGVSEGIVDLGDKFESHWIMKESIPTKVMVMAAAEFAIQEQGEVSGAPISAWVFPQNEAEGFSDYQLAIPISHYFVEVLGDYPFQKLANVQSKTRFGGMENAGNIFYSEESVTGTGSCEALMAHEIAHQWFGNSASEATWHDIWLSEGFATYFTNLYFEHAYGKDKLKERVIKERAEVIAFSKSNPVPVINQSITNYMELLNTNSYQKGAMILHMLRRELGDSSFFVNIRRYYDAYKYRNAATIDFQILLENNTGKDLDYFFKQWFKEVGQPELAVKWKATSKGVKIKVKQTQKQYMFDFPLDVKIISNNGESHVLTIRINSKKHRFELQGMDVQSIEVDPDEWLLFELESFN